jgi:hypothetical protein
VGNWEFECLLCLLCQLNKLYCLIGVNLRCYCNLVFSKEDCLPYLRSMITDKLTEVPPLQCTEDDLPEDEENSETIANDVS